MALIFWKPTYDREGHYADSRIRNNFTIVEMSSIVVAVFKATIGLLVRKGRNKAAEKLKDGDVTNQKFRGLIIREIDDIKSKLEGLSRKELLASISFFKEGIELLYEVFDKARPRSKRGAVKTQAACEEAFSLVDGMRKLELSGLDESTTRALSDAKERFKDARREATRAFANEALEISDRILAMHYRVMATILEKLDNPADAVAPCRVYIEELHYLSAVQEYFNVELTKGLRARFGKNERRKVIANVCHVNFVIYTTTLMVCFGNKELSNWPCVGSGEDKVNPLRDGRVSKILRKQGMEYCCVTPWSFGQEGEEEHKLKIPQGIATNSSGEFIVADRGDITVKVFDSCGSFTNLFIPSPDDVNKTSHVLDVASDTNDNIYVLVKLNPFGSEHVVYKFNNTVYLHDKFPVRTGHWHRLAVNDNGQVLVLGRSDGGLASSGVEQEGSAENASSPRPRRAHVLRTNYKALRSAFSPSKSRVLPTRRTEETDVVDVFDIDGQFVCSFGEGQLKDARDITTTNDGRVMVVDRSDSCVHIFSEDGDHLDKFVLQRCYSFPKIAFHRISEHVVVAGIEEKKGALHMEIFTKHGEFVRSTQIDDEEEIDVLQGIAVNTEGRIAAVFGVAEANYKLLVV